MSKTVYSIFWHTVFIFNQKEIAELECVNKDRPEMNCEGNCYLAKQLKKADTELSQKKSENNRSLENWKQVEGSVFLAELCFPTIIDQPIDSKKTISMKSYSFKYNFDFSQKKFNPPRA